MARNAQMERDLVRTGECDAPGFDSTAEGRRYATIKAEAADISKALRFLAKTAAYDPKAPLHKAAA